MIRVAAALSQCEPNRFAATPYDTGAMTAANHVVLILGPTAGGKSQLAVELAQQLPSGGEIISCDSMQIYRSMDIGTAKPSSKLRAAVPHHLIDIVEPGDDSFSVDRWLELADEAIEQIQQRGRTPINVGGTNL
jgi:tRNA dimethylallyltransferase